MNSVKLPVYQTAQIREFERLSKSLYQMDDDTLMQRAGTAAYDFMLKRWPQAKRIAVFVGGGGNGGDGAVLAKIAHDHGLQAVVFTTAEEIRNKAAIAALLQCKKAGVPIQPFTEQIDLHQADVLVDAMLGIGIQGNVRPPISFAIQKIMRSGKPVLSLDVPSGVNSDTGALSQDTIRATATITFIGAKAGLLTGGGIACTGDLAVHELQLPSELFHEIKPIAERIQLASFAGFLRARPKDWHKGLSGHVLIVGGELGYSGAARMAGEAALRVGAGLVSIATRHENALVLNVGRPELMCHGVQDESQLGPLLQKADVLVLGPGLSQSDWGKAMWEYCIKFDKPMLIDADGLNFLAKNPHKNSNWVLTPHPGEASRLLDTDVAGVQENRLLNAARLNEKYGGACVLKGAGSIICQEGHRPAICDRGNPGMASAGMGDVLSGVIGGLMAQNIPLLEAAQLGVCLHAMAGDLAAKEGERGLIATDLMPYLRRLMN